MFIVLLRFAENKANAGQFMDAHKEWINQGFSDGVFLLSGSLSSGQGGCVLTHGLDRASLAKRVKADPFVQENVVQPEIMEINPSRASDRLAFLLDEG